MHRTYPPFFDARFYRRQNLAKFKRFALELFYPVSFESSFAEGKILQSSSALRLNFYARFPKRRIPQDLLRNAQNGILSEFVVNRHGCSPRPKAALRQGKRGGRPAPHHLSFETGTAENSDSGKSSEALRQRPFAFCRGRFGGRSIADGAKKQIFCVRMRM